MTASKPSKRRYSVAHLIILIPWIALVIDAWAPIRDNSFLWHIRAGALQAETVSVITTDPFSFTMNGAPWLTQSWLVELLYAWGESRSGLGFVPPMLLTVTSLTFCAIGLVAFRRSKSIASTAIVMMLSTVLLLSFLAPRPVVFSFALFVLVVLAWDVPRFRWVVPLIFWIWASVHGSFVIGLGYVALSIVMKREWRWLPTALFSGFATLVTAHGVGVVQMLMDFADARDALALLSEWRNPELWSVTFFPFALGIVIIVIGAVRQLIAPRHLWLIIPFTSLALTATRAVPPAWIGLLPLIAMSLQWIRLGAKRRFSALAAAVFLVAVVALSMVVKADAQLDDERFPLEAVKHLEDGRTFHDDRVGGFLIWAEGPERLVYIDDRAELYKQRIGELVGIRGGETDWEKVFERDDIEQALLHADEDLVNELASNGWTITYEDESFVLMKA